MIRTYSELIKLPTFEERFRYLQLNGSVGKETFGYDRYLNQVLYKSKEWKSFRNEIILRDDGCDLAFSDRPLFDRIILHHLNPLTDKDILMRSPKIFDPENIVCTCLRTHNAIHYGDESQITIRFEERKPNDTCPWKS